MDDFNGALGTIERRVLITRDKKGRPLSKAYQTVDPTHYRVRLDQDHSDACLVVYYRNMKPYYFQDYLEQVEKL